MIIFDDKNSEKEVVFFSDEIREAHTIQPCMCGTMPDEQVVRNEKFVSHTFRCPKCGFFSVVKHDLEANRNARPTPFRSFRFDSILAWNRSVEKMTNKEASCQ